MRNQNGIAGKIVLVGVIIAVIYGFLHMGDFLGIPKTRGIAGIPAPVLKSATGQVSLGQIDAYQLEAKYIYSCEMQGLVVKERHYNANSMLDKLAPVDAVIAWGAVAEYNDKIDFDWEQPIRRTVSWSGDEERYVKIGGSKTIYESCTDASLIPADDTIREELKNIKQGDHLRLSGYLVNVSGKRSDGGGVEWWTADLAKNLKGENDEMFSLMYVTGIQWLK